MLLRLTLMQFQQQPRRLPRWVFLQSALGSNIDLCRIQRIVLIERRRVSLTSSSRLAVSVVVTGHILLGCDLGGL